MSTDAAAWPARGSYAAGGRGAQSGQCLDELALTIAGNAGNPEDFPGTHGKRDPAERRRTAVAAATQVKDAQDRRSLDRLLRAFRWQGNRPVRGDLDMPGDRAGRAQVAARMVQALGQWRRFDPARQTLMKAQLQRIHDRPGLSTNTFEMVSKSLVEAE